MLSPLERIKNGVVTENVTFVQVLAMCPTLAVTTSAKNGLGMGFASTVVLIGSNIAVALLKKLIPDKIRIPAYIVLIATFVTSLQLLMEGFVPALNAALGIFIPLIVVNCVILGRAEAFASKHSVKLSIFDAIGQGLGFTISLTIIGMIREFLGTGKLFDHVVTPASFEPSLIMILAPGAFFTLGILMALINKFNATKGKENKRISEFKGCNGNCDHCSHKH